LRHDEIGPMCIGYEIGRSELQYHDVNAEYGRNVPLDKYELLGLERQDMNGWQDYFSYSHWSITTEIDTEVQPAYGDIVCHAWFWVEDMVLITQFVNSANVNREKIKEYNRKLALRRSSLK